MKGKKLVDRVVDNFEKASDARRAFEERWKRYYDLYRCRPKPQREETRANIFVPEIYTTIETLTPRLVSNFLNTSKPIVQILGREESDMDNALASEKLLSYQFERMSLPLKLVNFYKQALIYGTSIGKVYWDYSSEHDEKGYEIIKRDEPAFDVLNLFDFFVDPEAVDIDDARFCIHRSYLSVDELKKRESAGIYKDVDLLKTNGSFLSSIDNGDDDPWDKNDALDERNIEILEYWENDRVITVADRCVVLRDTPNPFHHNRKPFVRLIFVPVPFEFYGVGVIEPIEGLQLELNTKRNQRLDNVNMVLNRMWLLQRGALDDLRQLHSRPGGVIVVNDLNGLQPLPSPDVTSSSYQEEEKIKNDIQNTSGVSDYIRGSQSNDRHTATEVRIKSEQSNTRFDFNFKLMAEMGLKRIAQLVIKLDQQFIDEERTIRIIGKEGVKFVKIAPEEIAGEFDLIPNVDPMRIDESEKRQQMMTLYSNLIKNPVVDQRVLSRRLLETYDFQNAEEMLKDREEFYTGELPENKNAAVGLNMKK